jgi:DNA-binding IclR family transcriptional regulator
MREATLPPPEPADERSRYVIASALRTLEVLRAFTRRPHRLGLAEVTALLGLERNQAYRSLKTLEAAGFLRLEDDGRYVLTHVLHLLSAAVAQGRQASLVEIAAPFMNHLAAETGESVHLGALAGDQTVVLDKRESAQRVRLSSVVLGQTVPLHAGAVPKAILSAAPEELRERVLASLLELPRFGPGTATDPNALRRELDETRRRGYSISDGDFDGAARGAGAPLFDATGQVVGGISVGGPTFRVDDADLRRFGELVREAARGISRELGDLGRRRDPPDLVPDTPHPALPEPDPARSPEEDDR